MRPGSPLYILGPELLYWLTRLTGWMEHWRSRPGAVPRSFTVRRGELHVSDAAFTWRDFWRKPPPYRCQSCGRLEGRHHSPLCADQNVLHPEGTIVSKPHGRRR